VAPEILARQDTKCIFMLRGARQSIKSIMDLYKKIDSSHAFSQAVGAVEYYKDRLNDLAVIAAAAPHGYYYLDAEDLIESTTDTLNNLSDWLELSQPLKPEYNLFNKTGAPQAGDPSDLMNTGRISKSQHDYSGIELPSTLLDQAVVAYDNARAALISRCDNKAGKYIATSMNK
jgi:hypothetical protein